MSTDQFEIVDVHIDAWLVCRVKGYGSMYRNGDWK